MWLKILMIQLAQDKIIKYYSHNKTTKSKQSATVEIAKLLEY